MHRWISLVVVLAACAPAAAATPQPWSGSMASGAAMSFVVGADGRVRGLDVAWVRTVCSDGVDHVARLIARADARGIAVDRTGRFHGTLPLRTPSGTAEMRGEVNGTVASGSVRARFTQDGATCDSGSGPFTARRPEHGGGGSATPVKPSKGMTVKRAFAAALPKLAKALRRLGALSPELAPAAAGHAMQSAGDAIRRAATSARTAVRKARAGTARVRQGRTQALKGFAAYASAGRDIATAGRYLPTDDPRGETALERGIKRMASGRAALRRAGRLLGVSTKALPAR